MKTPTRTHKYRRSEPEPQVGSLAIQLLSRLIGSLGQLLAFIFVITLIGIQAIPSAHSWMHVVGITAIVITAIAGAILSRAKKLL
jgi:hypothetical protein